MDGSRTHRGLHNSPPPILKTGEPTGTHPSPYVRIIEPVQFVKEFHVVYKQGANMCCDLVKNKRIIPLVQEKFFIL